MTRTAALIAGVALSAGCRETGPEAQRARSGGRLAPVAVGGSPRSVADAGAQPEPAPGGVGGGLSGSGGLGAFAGFGDLGSAGSSVGVEEPNTPPIASFITQPLCGDELQASRLVSTSVDPDGDPLRCEFSTDAPAVTPSAACVVDLLLAESLLVTLTVDDGRGGVDSVTMRVTPCAALP